MANFLGRAMALMGRKAAPALSSVASFGRWVSLLVSEAYTGAFQKDVTINQESVLAQSTVFSCTTLIASDIAKCQLNLMERRSDGVWEDTEVSSSFYPVLRKPNAYQTRQRFVESWVLSLLTKGNTITLKQRDDRGLVVGMSILDYDRVETLVAQNGDVYYRLQSDVLNTIPEEAGGVVVPADEIIHDRINCLFHPLVGLSPIFACGLAATQALKILNNSAKFFENMSRPGGILSAPAAISDSTAARLKKYFEENYKGDNIGRLAVLGDGLKYEAMSVNPIDAQLVEQLKMSAEQICAVFHVPAYMVGAAQAPAYNNVEALNQQYYSQCLQSIIESIEANLDEGLDLPFQARTLRTEFDLDDLLRMDQATKADALVKLVGGGVSAPNEARARMNMKPLTGGDTVYLQQQNYSLAALSKRDAGPDPFGKAPAKPAAPAEPPDPEPKEADQTGKGLVMLFGKSFGT